ncbi:PepSY domain-containing protein [Blastococcus sp. TF02-09]|uniref:PepSY domain-containing protein n=1 Tax=Blastococcus sp. TF02-09 TaxID=2250576 RepID=UPI000DE9FE83|nr:PepSY domain-containing protein [Blastococcus sp. TF02-9]
MAAIIALTAAGCGDDSSTTDSAGQSESSSSTNSSAPSTTASGSATSSNSPSSSSSAAGGPSVSLEDAGAAALQAVPDSTVTTIETERGGTIWEVQVVTSDGTEQQVDVDAETGDVVDGPTAETDSDADKAKHRDRVAAAELDYRAAAEIMRTTVPGAQITELDLDSEAGRTVWEADLVEANNTKHEVTIDAASGEVLQNNVDED